MFGLRHLVSKTGTEQTLERFIYIVLIFKFQKWQSLWLLKWGYRHDNSRYCEFCATFMWSFLCVCFFLLSYLLKLHLINSLLPHYTETIASLWKSRSIIAGLFFPLSGWSCTPRRRRAGHLTSSRRAAAQTVGMFCRCASQMVCKDDSCGIMTEISLKSPKCETKHFTEEHCRDSWPFQSFQRLFSAENPCFRVNGGENTAGNKDAFMHV